MVIRIKTLVCDIVVSFVIIFFVIISGNYVAKELIENNDFLMQNIDKIKMQDNILNKGMILFSKDARVLVRKYIEAVANSFIEFEQLPSFKNMQYFFELVVNSLENDVSIEEIEIYDNKIILLCQSKNIGYIDDFIIKIKDISYIDDIFYKNYNLLNDVYKVKIYCIHNGSD